MDIAKLPEIKKELQQRSNQELITTILKLARFKKENKELLNYLLFEAENEHQFIENIKTEVTRLFLEINPSSNYFIKKSSRKILRRIKQYIRYSKQKESEIELLLHFCHELNRLAPKERRDPVLQRMIDQQISMSEKAILKLHHDLQVDYKPEIDKLKNQ